MVHIHVKNRLLFQTDISGAATINWILLKYFLPKSPISQSLCNNAVTIRIRTEANYYKNLQNKLLNAGSSPLKVITLYCNSKC